jgi:hypothetical protein
MRVMRLGIAPDDNLATRNLKINADPEQIALLAARVPALNDNAAGHYSIEEPVELIDAFVDSRRDRVGGIHVAKADLKRELHRIFSLCSMEDKIGDGAWHRIDPAQSGMAPIYRRRSVALRPSTSTELRITVPETDCDDRRGRGSR